ncbi:HNH endonuclease [Streptomyces corynorhini]|uniref:HNH endonuclease n=1 Tax=Streptomyces corynorhini TaxID=2282652 RepID=A0A370BC42_9ACTN|nr:hypothetical protein [Streptomyces corynorhini]RDG37949.1 hypothetical protein DVH02_11540 [Streptomyces corynorhini]
MTQPQPGDHWTEGASSRRTAPRPTGWKTIRAEVLARDGHQCTWIEDGERCAEEGTDADHIGAPDDHSTGNLRTLCGYHHRKRTALQANQARGPLPSRQRPAPRHPGLIETSSVTGQDSTTPSSPHQRRRPNPSRPAHPGTPDDPPPF